MEPNAKRILMPMIDPQKTFAFPDKPPECVAYFVRSGMYYGYNTESVLDYGWGCAWRCIQMVLHTHLSILSSTASMPTFAQLFEEFGAKEKLMTLYKSLKPSEKDSKYLEEKKFAPHDLELGWAEPFIGQLVLFRYGRCCELLLVNGYPDFANAPSQVFSPDVLSFSRFVDKLLDHFKSPLANPVMLDDATFALCIIGIGTSEEEVTIWIADPHIAKKADSKKGLYTVTLNMEGKFMKSSVNEEDRKMLYLNGCDQEVTFITKKWMVLI